MRFRDDHHTNLRTMDAASWRLKHRSRLNDLIELSHRIYDSISRVRFLAVCRTHKFSSLMILVSFQITIIRSNQRNRIYEKSRHSKISSWDSSKSFGSCDCRFFLPLERTFSRENAISKWETHGRATHNRAYALSFYDALASLTIWRLTIRRIESFIGTQFTLWSSSNIFFFIAYSTDKRSRTKRRFTTQGSCAGRLQISRDTTKHLYCVNVRQRKVRMNQWKRKKNNK